VIEDDAIEPTFIRQALSQALERGLITRQQLRKAQLNGRARKMVEEVHGGTLTLASAKGEGTTVTMVLPREQR